MKNYICTLVAILMLCGGSVFAEEKEHRHKRSKESPESSDVSSAVAKSDSSASASQSQEQKQKQNQEQSQSLSSSNSANNGGQANSQSTEFNQVHQAPPVIAPEAMPTAPCRVGGSVGGSWLTGGIAVGGSKEDSECNKRETARSFALLGERDAAIQILCTTKTAIQANLDICKKPAAVAPSPSAPASGPQE